MQSKDASHLKRKLDLIKKEGNKSPILLTDVPVS